MDFDLAPPTGVGPLRIGMTRQAANAALDSLRDLSAVLESDQPGRHVLRPNGLMISIHCTRDRLEAIELGRPSTQADRVVFRGLDVFALPAGFVHENEQQMFTTSGGRKTGDCSNPPAGARASR
jgi:hypothetical protein